jgi:sugar phosphate isomerase/epimerase
VARLRLEEDPMRAHARPTVSRRQVLATFAATAAVGVHGLTEQPSRRWGIQLYTVREQITRDPAATLKQIAAIGYKELEVLQPTLATIAQIAFPLGLALTSVHLDDATAKGEGFESFLADAKRLGLRYVVVASIPSDERTTDRARFDAIVARFSRMSRTATAAGLQLCYHNHAFEFGQDADGARWLDVLMRGTADAGLQLELDVFWASFAGADPVTVLGQYKNRLSLVHLKDRNPNGRLSVTERASPTDFVEVGSGALDFPAILTAARQAGVRHYFVEQDETAGDPLESLRKSYTYLAGLKG